MQIIRSLLVFCLVASSGFARADFSLPTYEKYTLANGLTVYLMQQSEVPLVDVQWVVKAGAVNDEKSFGLANLTAESVAFGAGTLTKTQIEDKFDFYGAQFSHYANKENSVLKLSLAVKDSEILLPIFADLVEKPQFNENEFTKYKARYLSELIQRRESPKQMINNIFDRTYYGEHPYGNPVSGDETSVNNINLASVKQFYQNFYTPDNSALIIVGDINIEQWKAKVARLFGQWSGKAKQVQTPIFSATAKLANVVLIDKADANETTFMIGGQGVAVNNSDSVAISVINTILGGRFTSWLNDELRVNSGLTYGAVSRFNKYGNAGTFYISTFTKKSSTFEAIDLAMKTYQRLWQQGIDQKTLDSAKAYVKGQFPPNYETSGQLASLLSTLWTYQLSDDYINSFEQKVDSLTLAKSKKLIEQYFPKQNLHYVLIGNAKELKMKAEKYGKLSESTMKSYAF
jgi:predicted Zn-dependent peptidase